MLLERILNALLEPVGAVVPATVPTLIVVVVLPTGTVILTDVGSVTVGVPPELVVPVVMSVGESDVRTIPVPP
jgi:hypothetical protein